MVLVCNELPSVLKNNEDIWQRVCVVDFISKFCYNPDPQKSNEFVVDRNLQSKLVEWREVFMYLLIQHYQKSIRETV